MTIPDDDVKSLRTVGDAVAYIQRAGVPRRDAIADRLTIASSSPVSARPRPWAATSRRPGRPCSPARRGQVLPYDWAEQLPVRIAAPVAVEPGRGARARRGPQARPVRPVRADRRPRRGPTPRDAGRSTASARRRRRLRHRRRATLLSNYDALLEKGRGGSTRSPIPMLMPNGPAATVGLELGAKAGVHTPVSACASGAEAIAYAVEMIRSGRADVVVAGGTEAAIHPLPLGAFASMMALSKRNDEPERASRPYDKGRDGFVLGEGAGRSSGVRPSTPSARRNRLRRGRRHGISSDAHHIAQPDPVGRRAPRAMRFALETPDHAGRDRPHQRARHVHPAGRRGRGGRPSAPPWATRPQRWRVRDQVDDRPPARRRRGGRGHRRDPGAAPPPGPADDQPRGPRRRRPARRRARRAPASSPRARSRR